MVHKRFVRRGNKIYGPYLYNSKRVGNKVVNEYLGIDKSGEWKKIGLMVSFFVIILFGLVYAEYGIMSATTGETNSNLTIWDGTSSAMDLTNWYSNCTSFGGTNCGALKDATNTQVKFYANYSNSTVGPIMGNCSIRFNYTYTDAYAYSAFSEMTYNAGTKFYEYNSSFNKRGNFTFNVNCTNSTYDTLDTIDSFEIKSTSPYNLYGLTSIPQQACVEDSTCTYNASVNFTDDDDNDLPLSDFLIAVVPSTIRFADCVSINNNTGIITVACTNSSQAGGPYNLTLTARDGVASTGTLDLKYAITAVNDAPIITASTLAQSCTEDTLCSFYINAFDEENGTITSGAGAVGNLTFTDNSSMFTINRTNGSVIFTPLNANVGNYSIEINVTDPNSGTNSSVLALTISGSNDPPTLFFACNTSNNTILQEDVNFSCMLNTSDIDEGDTHTYAANYSWFTISCGAQTVSGGNTSCNVTFAPTDAAVYSHWITLTVTDGGLQQSTRVINFTVNNTEDFPIWKNISTNYTAWANATFWARVNATDDDSLTQFGDHVNYSANYSWFSINYATGIIEFNNTALNDKVRTYWINVTANDSTGRQNSTIINFTVYANSYPTLNITQQYNLTEGHSFSLNISANVTEPEGDYVNYTDNASLFAINPATGMISFTPSDSDVGTHWVLINVTDSHGTTNTSLFNFTVYNEEDNPVLNPVYNITDAAEGVAYTFIINLTDADLNITGGLETINVLSNSTSLFTLNINVNRSNATNGLVNIAVSFTPSSSSNGTYWINVTINDSAGLGDSQLFFINVSEQNTAPFFINGSSSFCTTRIAAEDSLFTSCTIIGCDNDTSTILRFASNYSWFVFNTSNITAVLNETYGYCSNVTANFTPTQNEVGNWSILLNVTDEGGLSAEYVLYFNVTNTNDGPNLTSIPMLNASIDALFTYDINATLQKLVGSLRYDTDADNDTLTFSVNATYLYATVAITLNSSTGIISFTPTTSADASGVHSINITINDTNGVQDSQIVTVNVSANQPPTCSAIANTYLSPAISFDPRTESATVNLTENQPTGLFSATCTDPEGETSFTYTWYWNNSINQSNSSNSFSYKTTYLDAGYYNITLNISDSYSQRSVYFITVNVSNINAPPSLISNIPNISTLPSGNGWYNDVGNSRNFSVYFNDIDGDNLTYSWYRVAVNESFDDNNITRIRSAWAISGNWSLTNDSGNMAIMENSSSGIAYANISNLTYINLTGFSTRIKFMGTGAAGLCFASTSGCDTESRMALFNSTDNKTYLAKYDAGTLSYINNSSSFNVTLNTSYWLKSILRGNTTLVYTSLNNTDWVLVYNQTFNETASGHVKLVTISGNAIFDDVNVKDPNLRNMALAVVSGGNISMAPASGWHGELSLFLVASDGINSTDSNKFTLHIDEVTVLPPEVVTQTSSSSSTITQTKSSDLTILVPSMISLTPLSKTIVPVILKNTGQVDLNAITLTAKSNQTELKLSLNETSWTALKIGDSVYVNLDVDIGLLAPDRYTIRLDAESQLPALKRFAEIVVDVREKDAVLKAQLKEMIQFTRDLFLQNPECLELTELINEAEEKFRAYQYTEGLEMIHRANQGCKEFIAAKEGESQTNLIGGAKSFIQEHWKTIILEGIGLILAILLLVYYFQRRSATRL